MGINRNFSKKLVHSFLAEVCILLLLINHLHLSSVEYLYRLGLDRFIGIVALSAQVCQYTT